jgi:hypothetical protein
MHNILSAVDPIRTDDPPVIPSAREVNLDSRRLGRILYVAENSDVPQ